jgi:hypothetical protein
MSAVKRFIRAEGFRADCTIGADLFYLIDKKKRGAVWDGGEYFLRHTIVLWGLSPTSDTKTSMESLPSAQKLVG